MQWVQKPHDLSFCRRPFEVGFFTGYCLYFLCVRVSVCRQIYSVWSEFYISLAMLGMWKAGYSLIILIISKILMFLNSVRSLPMWKSVHFCTLGTHLPRSTSGCKEWFEFNRQQVCCVNSPGWRLVLKGWLSCVLAY